MISIAPTLFSLSVLTIPRPGAGSDISTLSRRVSRSATLDGGAALFDGGYSDGDRTFTVEIQRATPGQAETAAALVKSHPRVSVAAPDGLYLAVPDNLDRRGRTLTLRLLILERCA